MIGLKYTMPNDPSGYGQANRMDIMALWTGGVNVTVEPLKQMSEHTDYGITGDLVKRLSNKDIPYKIKITHVTPDLIPQYKEDGIYHIQRLVWEADTLPKEWLKPLSETDEIWCMTPQQEEIVRKSGISTPTYSFPQAIDVSVSVEKTESFEVKDKGDFVFYSIFQFINRKAPHILLNAYWKEFEGNDDVSLLIKTYGVFYANTEYQRIKDEIIKWKKELGLKHYPKILLVHKLLTEQEMMRFHKIGDVFVNPSASEAWCRPVEEAMLYGNPVISPECGITDILTPKYYYKVVSKEVQAEQQSFIPWYTSDMKWKQIDEDSLREQMRIAYQAKDTKAKEAQKFVVDNFSFLKIGLQMRDRLTQIYAKL